MTLMTLQEAFETGIRGIIAQGGPAMEARAGDSSSCRYRLKMPDGTIRKCAIGHLIPDNLYSPEMEEHNADQIGRARVLPFSHLCEEQADDTAPLDRMQRAHDTAALNSVYEDGFDRAFWRLYRERCGNVAAFYGLTMPEVEWPDQ